MTKVVLGVDLDEVVFSYLTGMRQYLADHYHRFLPDDPVSYSLVASGWFVDDAEFHRIHGEAVEDGLYTRLPMIAHASDTLWDLSNNGYMINIITSRFVNSGQHERVIIDTAMSLKKNHIPHSNIMFLDDKTRFLADTYIDDSPANIANLQDAGRDVIIFQQRYNELIPGERADNWHEVRELLRQWYGK